MSDVSTIKKKTTVAEVMKTLDSGSVILGGKVFKVLHTIRREVVPSGDAQIELILSCADD